jgi:hypothetical protein
MLTLQPRPVALRCCDTARVGNQTGDFTPINEEADARRDT